MMPMWLQLFILIGVPLIAILTNLGWILNHIFLVPKEAKILKKASRQKKPIVFLGSDDGYADLEILTKMGKEGSASTSKKQKNAWTGFFPRSVEEETEQKEKDQQIASFINKLSNRKLFLRHAKIPIWFSYSGKGILTSLYALVGLDLTKEMAKHGNPKSVVDLTEIKSIFPKAWDQSQIRGYGADAADEATFEAKKFFGMEGLKYFVLPGMIIIAIMVLAIIFLVLGK